MHPVKQGIGASRSLYGAPPQDRQHGMRQEDQLDQAQKALKAHLIPPGVRNRLATAD